MYLVIITEEIDCKQEILLHTLSENGVPNPATLETFIKEDIDDYGQKLKELYSKLEKVKKVETNNRDDSLEPEHSAPSDPREELEM